MPLAYPSFILSFTLLVFIDMTTHTAIAQTVNRTSVVTDSTEQEQSIHIRKKKEIIETVDSAYIGPVYTLEDFAGKDRKNVNFSIQGCINHLRINETLGLNENVIVSFIINKNGKASEAAIIIGENAAVNQEIIRSIEAMKPFTPVLLDGEPIRLRVTVPMKISID